jgi:hypothetical protein
VLISSGLRPPRDGGLAPAVRLAEAVGASGIEVGPGARLGDLRNLAGMAPAALVAGSLPRLPLGDGPVAPGKRLPRLDAVSDRDEIGRAHV